MKNIALIINSLEGGGAEKVVTFLANYYSENQLYVTIITLDSAEDIYLLNSNVRRVRLKSSNLITQSIELRKHIASNNYDKIFSFLLRANIVNTVSSFFSTRRVIISERTNSSVRYKGMNGFLKKMLLRITYFYSHRVIAISKGQVESLEELGVDPQKVKVIYNPCLIKKKELRELKTKLLEKSTEKNKIELVTVGRLIASKNQRFLIKLIKELKTKSSLDYTLTLIGDGPDKEQLRLYSAELGIEDSVNFLGWHDNPELILVKSDIFVFSSLYEGFGNVLVEAISIGLPIVSFDCPFGPREILGESLTEQLCPVNNMQVFIEKVEELSHNMRYRQEVIELCTKRSSEFDINMIAQEYLNT